MDPPVRTRPSPPATASSLWWLEPIGADRYIGWCREGAPKRAFGGQVAAQALAAAGADLSKDWYPASLHAYFVREGRLDEPVEYRVEPTSEPGEPVALFSVTAVQSDGPILTLDAAFEPAPTWPPAPTGVDLDPGGWQPNGADDARWMAARSQRFAYELRFAERPAGLAGRRGEVAHGQRFWFRTTEPLPDEPLQHGYALTYASDLFLVSTALATHGLHGRRPDIRAASIDHAVWFHRPVRVDDWVLYEQSSPNSAGARGSSEGRLVDPAGELVATVRQEVLMRVVG